MKPMSRLENKNQEREAEERQIVLHFEFFLCFSTRILCYQPCPKTTWLSCSKSLKRIHNMVKLRFGVRKFNTLLAFDS